LESHRQQQELKLRATVATVTTSERRRNIRRMLGMGLVMAIKKKPGVSND
jgi:hypothetical protein